MPQPAKRRRKDEAKSRFPQEPPTKKAILNSRSSQEEGSAEDEDSVEGFPLRKTRAESVLSGEEHAKRLFCQISAQLGNGFNQFILSLLAHPSRAIA